MTHSSGQDSDYFTLSQKLVSAGLGGCTADLVTFPLDTVKVWLQVHGESPSKALPPLNITKFADEHSKRAMSSFRSSVTSEELQSRVQQEKSSAMKERKKSLLKKQKSFHRDLPKKLSTNQGTSITSHAHQQGNRKPRLVETKLSTNFRQLGNSANSTRFTSRTTPLSSPSNIGLSRTIVRNVRIHGFFSLYGGLAAGLQRQAAFCAVRIGLYDSVKGFYQQLLPGSPNGKQIGQRILAGTTTAFIAVGLFQPTEVVKIRMQAQTSKPLEARLYSSSLQAYRTLFNVGVKEAWKGLETNAARLAVVNVCEIVTYDVVKETILDYRLMKDNPACHLTSAFIAGFITTVVASPIDVVKTRYMNSKPGQYSGPIDCAKRMFLGEGVKAFYKGFVPAYLRLGSWNIVMFVSYEQYKRLFQRFNK